MHSPVRSHVLQQLSDLLEDRRVVVWYDPHQDFASLFEGFQRVGLETVDARGSSLKARRLGQCSRR